MAKKKFDLITEIYAEAVKEVTATPENWMAFLRSASRNYRLPFDVVLQIKLCSILQIIWSRFWHCCVDTITLF